MLKRILLIDRIHLELFEVTNDNLWHFSTEIFKKNEIILQSADFFCLREIFQANS